MNEGWRPEAVPVDTSSGEDSTTPTGLGSTARGDEWEVTVVHRQTVTDGPSPTPHPGPGRLSVHDDGPFCLYSPTAPPRPDEYSRPFEDSVRTRGRHCPEWRGVDPGYTCTAGAG